MPATEPGDLEPRARLTPEFPNRLDSWKEIAAHLDRGIRTVKRWEKDEGLPVHRHLHRKLGSVYAYRDEVDAWLRSRGQRLEPEPPQQDIALPSSGRRLLGVAGAGVAVVGLLAAWYYLNTTLDDRASGQAPSSSAPRLRLAVLPFQNLTGDDTQEYFVDGVTEAVTTYLGKLQGLRVISRTTTVRYKGTKRSAPEIARELGIDHIVEGAVARNGNRVRVSAQLVDAIRDQQLWAQSYERELRDVLALQSDIGASIAQTIRLEVRPDARGRLARSRPIHPEAMEAYLKGRHHLNRRTPQDVRRSVDYFEEALRVDPASAEAYSGLSDAYRLFDLQGLSAPAESMPKAEDAARKALTLDDSLAEAHASLAGVLFRYRWDWQGAEREFLRSIELDPNYAEAYRAYGSFLMMMRRHDDALVMMRQARQLSPLSAIINAEAVGPLRRLGRYSDAIDELQKALELDPKFHRLHAELGRVYAEKGEVTRAIELFEHAATLAPNLSAHQPALGYWYAVGGRTADARRVLSGLRDLREHRFVYPSALAMVHLGLGENEEAVALLEQALEDRTIELLNLPLFDDGLSAHPRFRAILSRLRLADEPGYARSGNQP